MYTIEKMVKRDSHPFTIDDYTEQEKKDINKFFEECGDNVSRRKAAIRNITNIKTYDSDETDYYKRLNKIFEFKNDGASLESFIIRYGYNEGQRRYEEKNKKCGLTKNDLIEKYGVEKAEEICQKKRNTLDALIERHGEEEGQRRYNTYLKKRTEAYKKKRENGHIYPKYNRDYFIKLHGFEKGTQIHDEKLQKQAYKVSSDYYLSTYGTALGKAICKKTKDNTSLSSFIERYGYTEGKKRYDQYSQKVSFSNSLDGYITKFGKREGVKKFREKCKKSGTFKLPYSKSSTELFKRLSKTRNDCFYGKNESCLYLPDDNTNVTSFIRVYPDFLYDNKIIEFYGDYWHANPEKFNKNDKIHGVSAKDIWEKDEKRLQTLLNMSYHVMIIWEASYTNRKEDIITMCENFLNEDFFNDEIESIEEVGTLETVDINISGDKTFLVNGVLSHNSSVDTTHKTHAHIAGGISKLNTVDSAFAIYATDEDIGNHIIRAQQLKARNGEKSNYDVELHLDPKTLRISENIPTNVSSSSAGSKLAASSNNTTKQTNQTVSSAIKKYAK